MVKEIMMGILLILCHLPGKTQLKTKQVLINGSGSPIILLHGGTFDYLSFEAHAKLLSDSFTVIRMQQFNVQFANEGKLLPDDYSVRMESEGVKSTLDSLGIHEPIVLVGHSFGGVVAFDLALHHPGIIRSLVLVEAPLFDIAKRNGEYSCKMKQIDELTSPFGPRATITEEMIRDFRCKMTDCDTFDIRLHSMWPRWLKQKDRLRGLSVVSGYKVNFKRLLAFKKPVLVVTGTTTIEPNKTVDKWLSHEFPNAQTASLPGDHIAIYQKPEIFVELLLSFLRRVQPNR